MLRHSLGFRLRRERWSDGRIRITKEKSMLLKSEWSLKEGNTGKNPNILHDNNNVV